MNISRPWSDEAASRSILSSPAIRIFVDVALTFLASVSVLSAFWFSYPVFVGSRMIPLWFVREAFLIFGVVALWVQFVRHLYRKPSRFAPPLAAIRDAYDHTLITIIVTAVVILAYWAAFSFDLVSGSAYLSALTSGRSADVLWEVFFPGRLRAIIYDYMPGHYRPLALAYTAGLAKLNPLFLGWAGVGLHALNALLVAFLSYVLWAEFSVALLAGVLVAVLPQVIETVINADQASYLLYALFWLLALVTFCYALRTGRRSLVAASNVCFVLALLSHEMAVTLPFAIIAVALLQRPHGESRRFVRLAILWPFLILAVYVVFLGYYRYAGFGLDRLGMVWPLNWKRFVLSTTYIPFWSFLFPYHELASPRGVSAELWLIPILGLPLLGSIWLKPWKDPRFCFCIVAASIAIIPVANFFEMDLTWGSERYGYLSFLLLCIPYAYILTHIGAGPSGSSLRYAVGRILAAAVIISILSLFSGQMTTFARIGTLAGRVSAELGRIGEDRGGVGKLWLFNLPASWIAGNDANWGQAHTAAKARAQSIFPKSDVAIEQAGRERVQTRVVEASPLQAVSVEWRPYADILGRNGEGLDEMSSRQSRIYYWNDPDGRLIEVTGILANRLLRWESQCEIRPVHVEPVIGLSPRGNADFVQRGRDGTFLLSGWDVAPSKDDELILGISIKPLWVAPAVLHAVLNEIEVAWEGENPPGLETSVRIPVIPDGREREFRLRLGTSIAWLLATKIEKVWLRTPAYPLQIRIPRAEHATCPSHVAGTSARTS